MPFDFNIKLNKFKKTFSIKTDAYTIKHLPSTNDLPRTTVFVDLVPSESPQSCSTLQFLHEALIAERSQRGTFNYYPITLHISTPVYKHMGLYPGHKHLCLYPVDIIQSVTKSVKFKITVIPLIFLQITLAQATFFIKSRFLSL